jgi:protoheme IX farnesyltransferase
MLPSEALVFSAFLAIAGAAYLAVLVNALTALLGVLTLAAYIFVYTPLKTRTAWCTLVGAFPGAVPPLMGWAGARNEIDAAAWSLFAILFLWQMPHFFAIAWIFTEDYVRGGFLVHSRGQSAGRQIVLYGCALIPVSLLPALFRIAGPYYMWGAIVLGFLYLGYGVAVALFRSNIHAHRLLRVSVIYLPVLLALMTLDKR